MNRADCQRTFDDLRDECGFLTGFTGRAAAALIHLREAWLSADDTNRPGVARAIRELFGTRSLSQNPEAYHRFLTWGLDADQAVELWAEVSR